MDTKALSALAVCESCHHEFEISSGETGSKVTHKREYKVEDKSIFVSYYDCPNCGRRHYVQIDDAKSLEKLKQVKRTFIKLSIARRKDKEIPQNQLAKFKKARQDLSDYRMTLMREFTGKFAYDSEAGEVVELRFSI